MTVRITHVKTLCFQSFADGNSRVRTAHLTSVLDVLLRHQSGQVYKMVGDTCYGEPRGKPYFKKEPMGDLNVTLVGQKLTNVHTLNGLIMQIVRHPSPHTLLAHILPSPPASPALSARPPLSTTCILGEL